MWGAAAFWARRAEIRTLLTIRLRSAKALTGEFLITLLAVRRSAEIGQNVRRDQLTFICIVVERDPDSYLARTTLSPKGSAVLHEHEIHSQGLALGRDIKQLDRDRTHRVLSLERNGGVQELGGPGSTGSAVFQVQDPRPATVRSVRAGPRRSRNWPAGQLWPVAPHGAAPHRPSWAAPR